MLNRISRRSFLRCVGCAGVLAAAGALAGCQTGRKAVEVDVGDHISNSAACSAWGMSRICRVRSM